MNQNNTPALTPTTARQFDLILGAVSRGFRRALRTSELAGTERLPNLSPNDAWLQVEKHRDLLTHVLQSIGQFHLTCHGHSAQPGNTAPAPASENQPEPALEPDNIPEEAAPLAQESPVPPSPTPTPTPSPAPAPSSSSTPSPAAFPPQAEAPASPAENPDDTGDLLPDFPPANVDDLNSLFNHIAKTAPKATELQLQQRMNALRKLVRYQKEHFRSVHR